jgi:hypothetical protein
MCVSLVLLAVGGGAVATAGETHAAIVPSIVPDRHDAQETLMIAVRFTGEASAVPAPLRRAVIAMPAGFGIDIPVLRSCAPSSLRRRGVLGCSAHARIGEGRALAEARVGSQLITEQMRLWIFTGPPEGLAPSVEILAQGYTPFAERLVFHAWMQPAPAPYGEEIVLSLPTIPTLPLEPSASITALWLTLGESGRGAPGLIVPTVCPAGGFQLAAEFTYAYGASSSVQATAGCPS